MENLHCLWALSWKTTTTQVPYAEMRQCPTADNFFLWKLRYWRMGIKPVLLWKRTMKTSLQLLADPQPGRALLEEGCLCNKLKSWVTSSPSSTKAWKQQKRAWYAPTVTITLVIGSRSRPSSFPKNWARIFTRGGWPCGMRGEVGIGLQKPPKTWVSPCSGPGQPSALQLSVQGIFQPSCFKCPGKAGCYSPRHRGPGLRLDACFASCGLPCLLLPDEP